MRNQKNKLKAKTECRVKVKCKLILINWARLDLPQTFPLYREEQHHAAEQRPANSHRKAVSTQKSHRDVKKKGMSGNNRHITDEITNSDVFKY